MLLSRLFGRSRSKDEDERVKVARLETAEAELFDLKRRAAQSIWTLEERKKKNHWREAIEQMIQGV